MNELESLNPKDMECDDFFGFGVFAESKEPPKTIAEPPIKIAEPPIKKEEPKAEAPKVEEPKAETPKAEEPKAEAPKAEESKAEVPKVPSAQEEVEQASAKELPIKKTPAKPKDPSLDMAMSWMDLLRMEGEEGNEPSIEMATPRIELPRTETAESKQRPKGASPRVGSPFEQFLDSCVGRWINGAVWSLLAFLLAELLTHLFGARAYYALVYKWFVFPILSAIGAGLFYLFNREAKSVIERNVVTAIEVTALVVTLQGLVRLLWI